MDARWFAGRLKELRNEARLTQGELAKKAGLGLRTISHLEQGLREPTWATVLALVKALGVDPNAFARKPASDSRRSRGRPGRLMDKGSVGTDSSE